MGMVHMYNTTKWLNPNRWNGNFINGIQNYAQMEDRSGVYIWGLVSVCMIFCFIYIYNVCFLVCLFFCCKQWQYLPISFPDLILQVPLLTFARVHTFKKVCTEFLQIIWNKPKSTRARLEWYRYIDRQRDREREIYIEQMGIMKKKKTKKHNWHIYKYTLCALLNTSIRTTHTLTQRVVAISNWQSAILPASK